MVKRGQKECEYEDLGSTKYDEAAINSYQVFQRLRNQGRIANGLRFQVSIPTPVNTGWTHLDFENRAQIEPLYTKRLIHDMRNLQNSIPAKDLAIQYDCAVEFAYLEYERGRMPDDTWKPYFFPVKDYILDRIVELASTIDEGVWLGFHLCYGDNGHQHFIQPEDAQVLVDMANEIMHRVTPHHKMCWIHLPVPRDRLDEAYYEPLKRLEMADAKLYLGLVRENDQEGTALRIKLAQDAYPKGFGIATECGMGRTPRQDVSSIFDILEENSSAI
ncbi:MAG: hypothetical protein M1820_006917 [Bogoriella megaspora]|nr:MAG: hypothetical protein M1820_006917 [Bogoriella megaspora]